jgi:hypothetical protein
MDSAGSAERSKDSAGGPGGRGEHRRRGRRPVRGRKGHLGPRRQIQREARDGLESDDGALQDVKSDHNGIQIATRALAQVVQLTRWRASHCGRARPAQSPRRWLPPARPTAPGAAAARPAAAPAPASRRLPPFRSRPGRVRSRSQRRPPPNPTFVGFSGEIGEGGVIATYATFPLGTRRSPGDTARRL